MTTPLYAVAVTVVSMFAYIEALGGSASTLAITYGGGTVTICGIVANQPIQRIYCWRDGDNQSSMSTPVLPDVSFDFIAGGLDGFVGIRSGGFSLLYWNNSFIPKRLYYSNSTLLTAVTMGETQICAIKENNTTQNATCWRGGGGGGGGGDSRNGSLASSQFISISSGSQFSCGVLESSNRVVCWGNGSSRGDDIAATIQSGFGNETMVNIYAGGRHACGVSTTGFLICRGDNSNGQLDVPSNLLLSNDYFGLALGMNHTCGIRNVNHTVICWGGNGAFSRNNNVTEQVSFESVVAGVDFTCGLTTNNFSVLCWGPGWTSNMYPQGAVLPLPTILPGPCVQSNCTCGIYPQSQNLCFGSGNICRPCDFLSLEPPTSPPPAPQPPLAPSSPSRRLRRGLLAFAIVGSVGTFAGIASIIYFLWAGGCFGKKKVHNSVQPTITAPTSTGGQLSSSSRPVSRSSTLRRQGSRLMRRQRSGTSSKHTDRAEEFLFTDLAAATNNFSLENKIGAGSFGVVYKGKLLDGREVAIKRGETGPRTKKFQEKESAFDSELAFLSRLHHKHLVRLVGYCEERDEKLLVYEYMKNGALFDHLHDKNNVEKSSSIVNSWKMRIKIALDAARGIEYLHNYAVPPIIHRDIKSSNILIDANWIARVSDFGLSLMGPESNRDYSSRPMKAAGTVGYIDPEYYGLNVLTTKSDVYGLGVVLLELLTGKRAIFKTEENGGAPMSVVDFAVPAIMAGELTKILDNRVGQPEPSEEVEAVELVAYTSMHCVHLEGRDRPTISDIVSNLERALAAFDDSHGSISSGPISFISD
ncbi:putative serine/threonine-protein kinase-like protein CCR3 [Capsicum chacoense]